MSEDALAIIFTVSVLLTAAAAAQELYWWLRYGRKK